MKTKRRLSASMSEADAQLEGPSKRAKTAGDVAASEEHSPWQEPEHLILNRIIQTLMGLEEGPRWVRVASHVCSYWRATAQDVLMDDTAVSRPERPPMPQPSWLLAPKPEATVSTQAAVLMEAGAAAGVEANSRQHPDVPPPLAAAAARPQRPRRAPAAAAVAAAAAADSRKRAARRQQRERRASELAMRAEAEEAAAAAAAAAVAAAAAAAPPAPPGVAHSVPSDGSIPSGMARGEQRAGDYGTDSESDGSTGAQQAPGGRRRRRGGRGAPRARSNLGGGGVARVGGRPAAPAASDDAAGPSRPAAPPPPRRGARAGLRSGGRVAPATEAPPPQLLDAAAEVLEDTRMDQEPACAATEPSLAAPRSSSWFGGLVSGLLRRLPF